MANVIPTKITVKSTARLHMGFFDLHGGLGRKFGSIGLSLTTPSVELTANPSDKLLVTGLASQHAFDIAQKIITKLSLNGAVNLNVKQCIPQHAGLGSGTQFSLAIGAAISRLYQLNLNVVQIAELTGRGSRSGIGIAAFNSGGLLIDGGRVSGLHSSSENKLQEASLPVLSKVPSLKVPPLLARYDFPEHWRILLIFDASQPGIHGEEELVAFNKLPVFSENLAAHLCRSVLMQAMPALVEQDLNTFGRSIRELQGHVGDYFAPAQGGRYASKKVGAVLQYLESTGVACLGQSSWGPTGFAVFENLAEAEKHLQQLKITFAESNLTWVICSANNHGAEIIQA
ncbi:beta-ribofuranosylaminobenzene 5'-phosphate synthase family protein [Methylotenera sp.]|uniref:beta-ribofuranosylaminobenzene 5'-phosphate synthase family protein n=1 Tax=Methylotenera sp. TaxID=2051956 RepID=UPI00272EF610|nr:beta-ribofuranosylaminobenzene 5'-phosphate synthase family protein [Methylotenera sp.]MDP2072109.1 GHMP kinase [Methylotenera sp.]MDP3006881.1 GHMP kinase [Methylotenera sp.]MDP3007182.1 GHMP kinase [Methylotenera sp.]